MYAKPKNRQALDLIADLYSFADYDAEAGGFIATSYRRGHCAKPGEKIGTLSDNGYLQLKIKGRRYKVASLVWLWHTGELPKHSIDHIDQDKLNDRIENLRDVTGGVQSRNRPKRKDNSSGYTGVYFRADRPNGTKLWEAATTLKGVYHRHGYFETAEAANEARQAFVKKNQAYFTKQHGV